MKVLEIEQPVSRKVNKAHIDSKALQSLLKIVDDRIEKHELNVTGNYQVFNNIKIKPDKVTHYLANKKVLLDFFESKGVAPLGVLPYKLFIDTISKFGLFRFENLNQDGYTFVHPSEMYYTPEGLHKLESAPTLPSVSMSQKFAYIAKKIVDICSFAIACFSIVSLIKDTNPIYFWIVFGIACLNIGVYKLHDEVVDNHLKSVINMSDITLFTIIGLIELFFDKIGYLFPCVILLVSFFLIKKVVENTDKELYTRNVKHNLNHLLMTNKNDSESGILTKVTLHTQPPNDVELLMSKLYPMPFGLATESQTFTLSIGDEMRKILDSIEQPIQKITDFIDKDPIVYMYDRKTKLVVILAQYGELTSEKEMMEYVTNLTDSEILHSL